MERKMHLGKEKEAPGKRERMGWPREKCNEKMRQEQATNQHLFTASFHFRSVLSSARVSSSGLKNSWRFFLRGGGSLEKGRVWEREGHTQYVMS